MIVVSGVGLVTPLGSSRELTWRRLLAGETGIQSTPKGLEARVYDFSPNGARSRMGDFALLAGTEALTHAGLDQETIASLRIGCTVSQSKPVVQYEGENVFPPPPTLDASLLLSSFFGW